MKKSILNKITPDEALEILKRLVKKNKAFAAEIENEAEQILKNVDFEQVVNDVYGALEGLTEDEIYARSGSLRDGYSSPEDQAVELMEEAIEPYEKEVFRYLELGMFQEAKIYCMGVLKGIYRYDQESKSNSKGWFVDIPEECFGNLLEKWKKRIMGPPDLKELNDFLKTECSRWFSWALKL